MRSKSKYATKEFAWGNELEEASYGPAEKRGLVCKSGFRSQVCENAGTCVRKSRFCSQVGGNAGTCVRKTRFRSQVCENARTCVNKKRFRSQKIINKTFQ